MHSDEGNANAPNKSCSRLIEWVLIVIIGTVILLNMFLTLLWVKIGTEPLSFATLFSEKKVIVTLVELVAFLVLAFLYFLFRAKRNVTRTDAEKE